MGQQKVRTAAPVNADSAVPKYRQIVDNVLRGMESGTLKKGDALPSIAGLCRDRVVSRDTVVKAYNALEECGAIAARHGKGFYVATSRVNRRVKVLVMFDVLSNGFKERVYQGLLETAGAGADFDFYSHNFRADVFCHTLEEQRGQYEYYVVMPFTGSRRVPECLAQFDQEKLLLLDIDLDFPGKACAVIRQDHDAELERVLDTAAARFARYRRFELVFPESINNPPGIKDACRRFCRKHGVPLKITGKLDPQAVKKGTAYLVIDDTDLVALVKQLHARSWEAGKDVGIVSYNDTPLKEIAEGGVTVVSVDFREQGRQAGRQVLTRKKVAILEPTQLILRKTL